MQQANTNMQLATTQSQSAASAPQPQTGLSIFDAGQFEQLARIAQMMARSSLIPETLKGVRKGGQFTPYPIEEVEANCFRITEQASRWGFSPFALVDHASLVHGKLMWEGKLVSAVIEAMIGVRLNYQISGEGLNMSVVVSGNLKGESEPRTVSGSVKGWRTDQWSAGDYEQRLCYRGAREWCRRHSPGVMLGVLADDEELHAPQQMRNVTTVRNEAIDPFNNNFLGGDKKPLASVSTAGRNEEPERADAKEAHSTTISTTAESSPSGNHFDKRKSTAKARETPAEVDAPCRADLMENINAVIEQHGMTVAEFEVGMKEAGKLAPGQTLKGVSDESIVRLSKVIGDLCKSVLEQKGGLI